MIRISLRRTARLIFALAALGTAAGAAAQGTYPNRPITIVVGFSAGGTTDIITRLISDELRKGLGQPMVQAEVARILKDPAMRDKFIQQGADPIGSTPEEFAQYMKDETAKWAKVVKASGAKAD